MSNFVGKRPNPLALAVQGAVKLFGKKQKTYGTGAINKIEPNVPETKAQKIKRDLALATQKRKTSEVKLDNTIFRINQQKKRLEEKKAKGGRVGLKFGSKKSNVQKIQETFGLKKNNPKMSKAKKKKFPDLTGDGKVTFADILKGRGVKRG